MKPDFLSAEAHALFDRPAISVYGSIDMNSTSLHWCTMLQGVE